MAVDKLIGLGQRAGRLASGDFAVKNALLKGRAKLLIIAEDAAQRTRKELIRLAASQNIPLVFYGSKEELGRLTGKSPRSAMAFMDVHLAKGILGALGRGDVDNKQPKSWR